MKKEYIMPDVFWCEADLRNAILAGSFQISNTEFNNEFDAKDRYDNYDEEALW